MRPGERTQPGRFFFFFLLLLTGVARTAGADIPVDTESLQLRFSEYGDLVSVRACLPDCGAIGAKEQQYESYRGFVSLDRDSGTLFVMDRKDSDESIDLVFTNLLSNEVRRWRIPHTGWLLGLELSRKQGLSMASGGSFLPAKAAGFGAWLESLRYVVFADDAVRQSGLDEPMESWTHEPGWVGYRNRFWAAMIRPDQPVTAMLRTGEQQAEAQLDFSPRDSSKIRYLLYAGPVENQALKSADYELGRLMYSGLWTWLGWLCHVLAYVLASIQAVIPSWAVSIILLSLAVQLIMRPLNSWSERIQDSVQETESRLAPALREIRQNYKGSEQAEKILALYKDQKVHPLYSLKSMAGLLLVVPVFIGVFNMLSENIWLAGESFFWISDLSLPDALARLPISIPFLGDALNLLPFIMVGLSIPASLLRVTSNTDSRLKVKHRRNLTAMSALFFLLFYTFPAGMLLYWITNNAVSLGTVLIRRMSA